MSGLSLPPSPPPKKACDIGVPLPLFLNFRALQDCSLTRLECRRDGPPLAQLAAAAATAAEAAATCAAGGVAQRSLHSSRPRQPQRRRQRPRARPRVVVRGGPRRVGGRAPSQRCRGRRGGQVACAAAVVRHSPTLSAVGTADPAAAALAAIAAPQAVHAAGFMLTFRPGRRTGAVAWLSGPSERMGCKFAPGLLLSPHLGSVAADACAPAPSFARLMQTRLRLLMDPLAGDGGSTGVPGHRGGPGCWAARHAQHTFRASKSERP
eukprot:365774-Chlamydomonas_euryale.AAC.2